MEVGAWARRTLTPFQVWGKQPILEFSAGSSTSGYPPEDQVCVGTKRRGNIGEENDKREDLFSMTCHESRQHGGKMLGSEQKCQRWTELGIHRALWNFSVGDER